MDERWDNDTDAGENRPPARRADDPPLAPPAPVAPPEPRATELATPEPEQAYTAPEPVAPEPAQATPEPPAPVLPPADPSELLTPGNYGSPMPPPGLTPPPPPQAYPPSQPQWPQQPPMYQPPQYHQPQQWQQPPQYTQPTPSAPRPIPGAVEHADAVWLPAGLGPRVLAFLIDGLLLMLAGQALVLMAGIPEPDITRVAEVYMRMWSELLASGAPATATLEQLSALMRPAQLAGWLNVAMCFCYFTAFHWLAGGTLGKLCLGLRVLRRDGRRLSLAWAALRYLGYFLCAKLIYTAWLVPLTAEKRTLYDLVLGTNVFRMKR